MVMEGLFFAKSFLAHEYEPNKKHLEFCLHKIQSPKNHEKQKIKKSTSPCSEPNNQKTSSLNKKKSNQNHLFRHAISLPCLCLNLEPMTFTESEAGIERKVVGEDIIPVSKWLINPINDLLNGCHSSRFQVLL